MAEQIAILSKQSPGMTFDLSLRNLNLLEVSTGYGGAATEWCQSAAVVGGAAEGEEALVAAELGLETLRGAGAPVGLEVQAALPAEAGDGARASRPLLDLPHEPVFAGVVFVVADP